MVLLLSGWRPSWPATTWLAGFDEETIATDLDMPTAFAHAVDGRIFVAENDGLVRVITAAGQLLPTPFVSVSVNRDGDRGLVGIALHPDFPNTPYVYLTYTTDIVPPAPINSFSRIHRVTRWTANGNVAVAGSEVILIDNIPSDSDSHVGGSIRFGADGKIYVSTGDGAPYDGTNILALRSLNVDQLVGKVLRVNQDGSAPTDNPYYTTPSANRSKVWQMGLRNPFRTTFRPATGAFYVGDVGWNVWDEVNVAAAGASFGWPCYEGNGPQPTYQSVYPAQCSGLSPAPTAPFYTYPHSAEFGGAVTGLAFFSGGNYPASYNGRLFIADYANEWIKAITMGPGETFGSIQTIAQGDGIFTPVDIAMATDGNLNYLVVAEDFTQPTGSVHRIVYVGSGNHAPRPVASAAPTAGYAPLLVNFSSAGTSDADNDPLQYHWLFGDGAEMDGANVSHTYAANGSYLATLQVSDGLLLREAKVQVTVGSMPPTATIATPASYVTYVVGESISFSGSAIDPDEGPLPPSALHWTVIQHHGGHQHHFMDMVGSSGSFIPVDHGTGGGVINYELFLTASDSTGLYHTTGFLIRKNQPPVANAGTDQATLCASPGNGVTLDGSLSSDPDIQPITYQWTQIGGPPVSLSGPLTAHPSFTAPVAQGGANLTFQLQVDDTHAQSVDQVGVAVTLPAEASNLQFQSDGSTLTWVGAPGATSHQVSRGTFTIGGFSYNHSCIEQSLDTVASDPSTPSLGSGTYYLVGSSNPCGTGGLGTASNQTQRPAAVCN